MARRAGSACSPEIPAAPPFTRSHSSEPLPSAAVAAAQVSRARRRGQRSEMKPSVRGLYWYRAGPRRPPWSSTSNSTSAPERSSSVSSAAASSAKSRSAPYRARLRMRGGFAPAVRSPAGGRRLSSGADGVVGRRALLHAEPLAAVATHVVDQRHERLTLGGERVLHPGRDLRIGVPLDDGLLLERPQPQRQRARADPRQRPLELAEPAPTLGQIADHEDRPLTADDVRGRADGARGIRHVGKSSPKLHFVKLCSGGSTLSTSRSGSPAIRRRHRRSTPRSPGPRLAAPAPSHLR